MSGTRHHDPYDTQELVLIGALSSGFSFSSRCLASGVGGDRSENEMSVRQDPSQRGYKPCTSAALAMLPGRTGLERRASLDVLRG